MEFERRPYRMRARAQSVAETGRRIEDAAEHLFMDRSYSDVSLQAIAEHAGVTLQTVLRRFGSKEALFNAVAERKAAEIFASREPALALDPTEAVRLLVASYEEIGDMNWRALEQEGQSEVLHRMLDQARRSHAQWLERCFAELLPDSAPERRRRITLLFAATDFYVWKLLRRDLGLPREDAVQHMLDLVGALASEFRLRDHSPTQNSPPTEG